MIRDNSVLAIILARGGSKRIKNKNIRLLNGKPLIYWTIDSAKRSKYIDRLIVSTDSKDISDIARTFGAEVPFLRPKHLALDTTTSESALLHAVKWIDENEKKSYSYILLLQPTSPLRTTQHIDKALETLIGKKAHSLISVTQLHKSPSLTYRVNKNISIHNLSDSNNVVCGSKKDENIYYQNGALYIIRTDIFFKSNHLSSAKTIFYPMNKYESIDIDEESDLKLAEFVMKQRLS